MRYRQIPLIVALLGLLAACGAQPTPQGAAGPSAAPISPVFAVSEAVVGRNRLAIGLLRGGTPINDPGAKVHLRFFDLNDTSAPIKAEADATYFGQGLPAAVYVAYATLDRAGSWGVEVQTTLSGQTQPSSSKLRLEVLAKSEVPNIGDKAISVKTLTVSDVPDPAQLSSGAKADPALYQISLDKALASGKPTALLFATPGFCRTATCGPSVDVLRGLQQRFGAQMNFIHVEVYRYPFAQSFDKLNQVADAAAKDNRALTPAEFKLGFSDPVVAWGLATEPWLYLIDAKGTIVERFEGGITQEELGPILEKLIAGKPL